MKGSRRQAPLRKLSACIASLAVFGGGCAARTQNVRVAPDGKTFTLAAKPFTPFGFNYGHHGQLVEDLWQSDWPAVERDFADLRALGATVVRVHLQFGQFMTGPETPNGASLDRLERLLALAERNNLRLDLTGLACYRTADVPKWYDALDDADRWAAQARFWMIIAHTCRGSPAVFCYDLINEPISRGDPQPAGHWYSGKPFGDYDFIQFIALNPKGRREDVARDWVRTMVAAIHREDRGHLVTVGMLPWDPKWRFLSGFVPTEIAPELDFVSVHIYPEAGKVDEALEALRKFAVGKPVVIEETFPLYCSADELRQFILRSRSVASGWIAHYDGRSLAELRAIRKPDASQSTWLNGIELFRELGQQLKK